VLLHIPDKGHVTTRYYGWYANRPRGMRRQGEPAHLRTAPTPRHPAGTFGVRGGPTAATPRSPPAPAAPGHPAGPQAEQPAKRTGAVAVAPKPAPRCSRGSGPELPPPRLTFPHKKAYPPSTAIEFPVGMRLNACTTSN